MRVWAWCLVLGLISTSAVGSPRSPPVEEEDDFQGMTPCGAVARRSFSLTRLADGSFLVAGGMASPWEQLDVAQICHPRGKRLMRTGQLNVGRANHAAVLLADGR